MRKRGKGGGVASLAAEKAKREKAAYKKQVLQTWDDWDHADKRELLDRKGEVQIKARERL